MSVWAVLVVMTSAAVAAASWLAARSIAHLACSRSAGRRGCLERTTARQGAWAAYAATATGVGVATGHPFAVAVFLAPALAVDHLCARLCGVASRGKASTPPSADPVGGLSDESALHDAWREALRLGVDAAIVDTARERCDRLLRVQQAEPFELALLEWAVFLRRCVPELVSVCGDEIGMSEGGPPREAILAQTAEALTEIGAEAERRRGAGRAIAHHRFETIRDHARRRIAEAGHPD